MVFKAEFLSKVSKIK